MASYKATWDNGIQVEFRDLTWKEYQEICYNVDPDNISPDIAVKVYQTCCLVGPDLRIVTAGIGMFVAKHQIVNNPFSGEFESIRNVLTTARNYVTSNYLVGAQALIAGTLHYKIEEIKDWTAEKFFLRVAQAELIARSKLDPVSANAEPQNSPQKKLSPLEKTKKKVLERDNR